MTSQQEKKTPFPPVWMTVWQEAWVAVSQPRQYLRWAFQPLTRSLKYLAVLNLFVALITSLFFLLNIRPRAISFGQWASETIPMITFQEGVLQTENDQTVTFTDSDKIFIKLDPTLRAEDNPTIDNFYEYGLLITSEEIIVQDAAGEERTSFEEMQLGTFSFSGETIQTWIDESFVVFSLTLLPIIVFIYSFLSKVFFAAFFAFLFWIGTRFRANFEHLWNMAIYALTPAIFASYIAFILFGGTSTPAGFLPGGFFTAFTPWSVYTLTFLLYLTLVFAHYHRFLYLQKEK